MSATATATRPASKSTRKPRKPVARSIRVIEPGRVVITVGKLSNEYAVAEFICGVEGRGFRCERFGAEHYNVLLAKNGQDDRCDCMGFEAHGHCKHQAGLKALLQRGLLDNVPALGA